MLGRVSLLTLALGLGYAPRARLLLPVLPDLDPPR